MVRSLALTCVLASCAYDAGFDDCTVRCDDTSGCPDAFVCGSEDLCRAPGMTQACEAILGDAGTDAPTSPPSCAGLAATCGPSGTDDCCSIATPIPGGTYYRSYDVATDGMYPDMSYPATVSAFVLDKYEVTVGRFRAFVAAGGGTQARPPTNGAGAHANIPGSGWDASWDADLVSDSATLVAALQCDAQYQTWTTTPGANEARPIDCVTWYEAMAFCAWDGGYLPTEAEWNYAATGGAAQRAYPWSSPAGSTSIDCSFANYNPNYPSGPFCQSVGGANRVGSESPRGDGNWGQSDLGGNVDEWVLDWYSTPYSTTCEDCADLTNSGNRVVRGGDWINADSTLRTGHRNYTTPTGNRDQKIGFRCARPTN